MMQPGHTPFQKRSVGHLVRQVLNRNSNVPNFAVLLGSGASVTSGVATAAELIEDWRAALYAQSGTSLAYDEWVTGQSWFRDEDEYAILFEAVYDQPVQRRNFIEEQVKGARPGWGYVYLTNQLAHRIFDVVFTTNFDDLVNEACFLYSESLRPIVAAHDSTINNIRVTANRPKIVKLHGDFLYDNIKNTVSELETLEANTKRKFGQFAQEYGLVVVGYSGRDRSIMDTLSLLIRNDENFAHGVYWCVREGFEPGKRLSDLLRRERVYLVTIEGFDEFMADLHAKAELPLPRPLADPFHFTRDRARLFVNVGETLQSHPVIAGHIRQVLTKIEEEPNDLEEYAPAELQAQIFASVGDVEQAKKAWQAAVRENAGDEMIAYSFGMFLTDIGDTEGVQDLLNAGLIGHAVNKSYLLLRIGNNQGVIEVADRYLSPSGPASINSDMVRINRAIAYKRLGNFPNLEADLRVLESHNPEIRHWWHLAAGIAALRNDKREMLRCLARALRQRLLSPGTVKVFPVFEDYREDPDVNALLDQYLHGQGRKDRQLGLDLTSEPDAEHNNDHESSSD